MNNIQTVELDRIEMPGCAPAVLTTHTICECCADTGWAFLPHSDEARERCSCSLGTSQSEHKATWALPIYTPDAFRGRTVCEVLDAANARARWRTIIAYVALAIVAVIGPSVICAIVEYCMGY